jgi:hypothetical protein
MSEWISADDRLPPFDQEVLCREHGRTFVGEVGTTGVWWDDESSYHGVTHWMPLPDLPK